MLEGLMQDDFPLTLQHILWRMRTMNAAGEVVTLTEDGSDRSTYGEVAERVDRLCNVLRDLGVGPGDRVATFGWNTQRHLELYLAVPCMGAVLHTLNIRLFPEQLTYIVNHAQDKLLFVDESLVEQLEPLEPTFETVQRRIVLGDEYEELLAAAEPSFDYPEVQERQAAGLCYTSGTTGNPKGVLYSHRSNMLNSLPDAAAISRFDVVLPVVPMFHANAWGHPYAAALLGSKLVLPSRFITAERLTRAIEEEKVTISCGVPTVWLDILAYADEHEVDLSTIDTMLCGGAAVPASLIQAFEERHDVRIIQGWGMTETNPVASTSRPPEDLQGEERWAARARQGRIQPLLEARLVDDDGNEVPWDGESTGELQVRGPWIARSYYEDPSGDDKFSGGWLRTGDIASLDGEGSVRISDRSKDVIKSGGEWISSVDLENAIMAHPDVREAAVIGMPHERYTERPLACVVLRDGAELTPDAVREHLTPLVAKWWLPDEVAFVDEIPKTSVGKFDKKVLRSRLADGELLPDSEHAASA
jgi:fatty-acyl-CoA synthase